jgi:sugar (pentulose or hexulose) kinase
MQLKVVAEAAVNFSKDLPHYNTTDGFVKDGLQVTSPTLMFVEALELALQRLKATGRVDFSQIVAISNSGQQHGISCVCLGVFFFFLTHTYTYTQFRFSSCLHL